MPITVKQNWAHGDSVPASEINKYKADIEELATLITGKSVARLVQTGDTETYIIHRKRWGLYNDNGTLESLDGLNTVSLSDPGPGAATAFFDLDSLSWMVYGQGYKVINIDYWEETDNPS